MPWKAIVGMDLWAIKLPCEMIYFTDTCIMYMYTDIPISVAYPFVVEVKVVFQ